MSRTDYWREYKRRWLQTPENRARLCELQRQYRRRHRLAIKVARAIGVPIDEARRLVGTDGTQ